MSLFTVLWGERTERGKGKKSKHCSRRISSFSQVFPQRCSRSEMHTFQLSLVAGRDLLFEGYKCYCTRRLFSILFAWSCNKLDPWTGFLGLTDELCQLWGFKRRISSSIASHISKKPLVHPEGFLIEKRKWCMGNLKVKIKGRGPCKLTPGYVRTLLIGGIGKGGIPPSC